MEDNRLTYPVVVVSAISSILLKVGRSSLPVGRISPNGINWSLSPPIMSHGAEPKSFA